MEKQIHQYITTWEQRCYPDGIPDEAPREIDDMVPSYKRICIAIMKNDVSMLGFSRPASVWYGILKREEIEMRNKQL
jgi:predicted phosphoadenosine phosphosulfate sulfurtransferase